MSEEDTPALIRELSSAYAAIPRQFEIDPKAVKRSVAARRRRSRTIIALAGVMTAATVGGIVWTQTEDAPPTGSELNAAPIIIQSAGAIETYASSTARDWVRFANLVVLVKVTAESGGSSSPADDGTGDAFVNRSVTLQVDKQLWSRPSSPTLSTDTPVEVSAPGWVTHADGSKSRLATRGQPRLEVGHYYVVALVANVCETDTASGVLYMTLGSGGVLPVDGGQVGYGESEGRAVAGQVDQTTPNSLERKHLGDGPGAIALTLDAAYEALPQSPSSKSTSC